MELEGIGSNAMQFNVAQLLKGPTGNQRQYDLEVEIDGLDPELQTLQSLSGTVILMRTSQGILARGKLQTTLLGTCRRCLEPCEIEAHLDLEEEFHPTVPIGGVPLDAISDEGFDEALLIDEHHILDLSEVVRQALWLVGPSEGLCSPSCGGLCPRCGGNRNLGECGCMEADIDPRWLALQTLLSG